ncbi:hypothetical protein JZ751_013605 [Albula glossodonta]|uniref:Uncharacterized protein n=1 Tax=Albula glossodonta TaxID=121402 RepID=A0A8T2NWH7_9TELE|nr:hypothetical protein JZ751_013605 [Albula glossodonta]
MSVPEPLGMVHVPLTLSKCSHPAKSCFLDRSKTPNRIFTAQPKELNRAAPPGLTPGDICGDTSPGPNILGFKQLLSPA